VGNPQLAANGPKYVSPTYQDRPVTEGRRYATAPIGQQIARLRPINLTYQTPY